MLRTLFLVITREPFLVEKHTILIRTAFIRLLSFYLLLFQKMSSSSVAGPSRRANIIRVVRQTSGFAQAFRKLVSRALCVQLPSPEWTVGYYKNPLNPTDKVIYIRIATSETLKLKSGSECLR